MRPANLLPPEQRIVGTPGAPGLGAPVGALAVLAVLAVAVVALALHVQARNTVKDRQAELAGVTSRVQAVRSRSSALSRYTAFKTLASTHRQTVVALAEGRFDWAPTLRDIARVLPADAYLAELCGDAGAGSCTSTLRTGLANATAVTMTGCTSSQDAVATLMTRLRDVRGVTRVTLDSSLRPTQRSDASEVPGVRACPKDDPPQFSIVVFFERAPIAAAGQADGATAAATAAAAATPAAGAAATAAGTPATPAAGATATATPPAATATPSAAATTPAGTAAAAAATPTTTGTP